jgi:hypothetical protein
MAKAPSDYGHKSIKPLLVRVGLNEKEAEIYLALLSLKTAGASEVAGTFGESFVSVEHLFLGVLQHPGPSAEIFNRFRVDRNAVVSVIQEFKQGRDAQRLQLCHL